MIIPIEDYEDAAEASEIIAEAKSKKEKLYSFEKVAKIVGYKIDYRRTPKP